MKKSLLLLPFSILLLSPMLVFSQKMIRTGEWCAEGRKAFAPPLLILQDGRSDTFDILHTAIELSILNAPQITASCELTVQSKLSGISNIRLDLQSLTVDSVTMGGQYLTFSHTGPNLLIQFPAPLPIGQSVLFKIHYHGQPAMDASGWGGFYNQSGYTFNLGVGFAADPHSFGRAWFPCFDNFVERSTFDISVLSPANKPAYCNGYLASEIPTPAGILRRWVLDNPIPSYLACFAAGPYTSFLRTYAGEAGPIPVEIAAPAADTIKVRNTFLHLPDAIQAFEYWYGPHKWNKIGYSLVPFNSGAMEHATNIAIGRAFVDGSLNYETLWAHELSHHWWGDLATCSTAEDMWLNEGWAVFSEHLFTEKVYGATKYREAVKDNFLNVLQNAHVLESGYRAVSGIPHSLTYGTHVYNKGAVVAHNLRGYLGDSLFREGTRHALETTSFSDWSSLTFRQKLEEGTGKDLSSFFENWVFNGGFPDFSIDSVQWVFSPIDAPTLARVFVKQKLRGAPDLFGDVPLEFTFVYPNGQREHRTAIVTGENSMAEFLFPAWAPAPQFIFVNTNLKITLARSEGEKVLKTTSTHNFADAKLSLSVTALPDSALFRVEHHFVDPDKAGANPNGYQLTHRYWNIEAALPPGFDATASIFYDGRGQMDQLDTELFAATGPSEDSVLVLYRPAPGHPWQEWPTYTKITLGSTNDRYGQLRIQHVQAGQYTIGKGISTIATREPAQPLGKVIVSPNPARDRVRVTATQKFNTALLVNAEGETFQEWTFAATETTELSVSDAPAGQYWLVLSGTKGTAIYGMVIVK